MHTVFRWKGEPIADIEVWADARGERMVRYVAKRQIPCACTGRIETETYEGSMPESFWQTLAWQGGWSYRELEA